MTMLSKLTLVACVAAASAQGPPGCQPQVWMDHPDYRRVRVPDQPANSAELLVNGNPRDVLTRIPSHLTNPANFHYPVPSFDQFDYGYKVEPRTTFELVCPAENEYGEKCPDNGYSCMFYIYMYHCPPCRNVKGADVEQGDYPRILASDWERSTCAPKFVHDGQSYEQPMLMFQKVVSPHFPVTIPASTEWTDYISFFAGTTHTYTPCPTSIAYGPYPNNCGSHCPLY